MNRLTSSYLKHFSNPKLLKVKFKQKCSINIRNVILIFIRRNNWKTIGKKYRAMGQINVELSEYGFSSVFEELVKYEIRLSESDNLDDYDGSKKRGYILC